MVAPTISIIFLKRKYLHKHKRHRHADNGGDCVSDDAWTVNEIIKQPNDNCLYYEVRNIRYKEFYKLNKSQTFFKCKLTVQQIRHHKNSLDKNIFNFDGLYSFHSISSFPLIIIALSASSASGVSESESE